MCVCVLVICHVVGITYQTIEHRLLAEMLGDPLGNIHTLTIMSLEILLWNKVFNITLSHSYSFLSPVSLILSHLSFSPVSPSPVSLSLSLSDTQVKVWMNKYGWMEDDDGRIFIYNQEESVKPKNIVEKIDFDSETLHSSLAPFILHSFYNLLCF